MPCTRSSFAMSDKDGRVPLNVMTDVREITRTPLILAIAEISSSVMPSEKYSCAGSPERFSSGRMARESIRATRCCGPGWRADPTPPVALLPASTRATKR